MRRPALFCLMLLLAWRAWLGDAMALASLQADPAPAHHATAQALQTVQIALAQAGQASAPDAARSGTAEATRSPARSPELAQEQAHGQAIGPALGSLPCHDNRLPSAAAGPPASAADASTDTAQTSHSGTCTACQICHLAWLSPQRPDTAVPGQRFATPQSVEGGFQSACQLPQLKPPIA